MTITQSVLIVNMQYLPLYLFVDTAHFIWNQTELKFQVKWQYLVYLIYADAAFLLGRWTCDSHVVCMWYPCGVRCACENKKVLSDLFSICSCCLFYLQGHLVGWTSLSTLNQSSNPLGCYVFIYFHILVIFNYILESLMLMCFDIYLGNVTFDEFSV